MVSIWRCLGLRPLRRLRTGKLMLSAHSPAARMCALRHSLGHVRDKAVGAAAVCAALISTTMCRLRNYDWAHPFHCQIRRHIRSFHMLPHRHQRLPARNRRRRCSGVPSMIDKRATKGRRALKYRAPPKVVRAARLLSCLGRAPACAPPLPDQRKSLCPNPYVRQATREASHPALTGLNLGRACCAAPSLVTLPARTSGRSHRRPRLRASSHMCASTTESPMWNPKATRRRSRSQLKHESWTREARPCGQQRSHVLAQAPWLCASGQKVAPAAAPAAVLMYALVQRRVCGQQ